MRRIFFLGFPKTGTSTLGKTMRNVGLETMHHGPWKKWSVNHNKKAFKKCSKSTFDGRVDTDFEWLYETFPDSYFVLNTRNLKSWLTSCWNYKNWFNLKAMWARRVGKDLSKRRDWNTRKKQQVYLLDRIKHRNEWHQKVLWFFKDKFNFCTLDLGKESNLSIRNKLFIATGKKIKRHGGIRTTHVLNGEKGYVKNPEIVQRVLEKMNITPDQYDLLFIEKLLEK